MGSDVSGPGLVARIVATLRFRLLGLATIERLSADRFQALISQLTSQGWRASSRYAGADAGIDYDRLRLSKGRNGLTCEWDPWSEWSIEGPRRLLDEIAQPHGLKVSRVSRWAGEDEKSGGR